jgi:hypothetical protein
MQQWNETKQESIMKKTLIAAPANKGSGSMKLTVETMGAFAAQRVIDIAAAAA